MNPFLFVGLASAGMATAFSGMPTKRYLWPRSSMERFASKPETHEDLDSKLQTKTFTSEGNSMQGDASWTQTTVASTNLTIQFPTYSELMNLSPGECVNSEPFICGDYKFRLNIYPRGAQDKNSKTQPTNSGFGMSYRVLPMFNVPYERVGVYLQYLPEKDGQGQSPAVDTTFAMRLKGNQVKGRKFDVEWRAGMRFVELEDSNLAQGQANDFGAHLMQTFLLQEFMGISDEYLDNPDPLKAEVELIIHDVRPQDSAGVNNSLDLVSRGSDIISFFGSLREDIRIPTDGTSVKVIHDPERVRVGKIVVPILKRLRERPHMFQVGAYPGVEYRILRILDPQTGEDRFSSVPNATYEMRPIYPLVRQLERQWPVQVKEQEIPKLFTQNMYNAVSAIGSLVTALFGLLVAFSISQGVSLFFIPSKSMDPTLQVGDVLLVDKVTPRVLGRTGQPGDVVLFAPPQALRDLVAKNGGKLTNRDLFVKRVAAVAGDAVSVSQDGRVQINGQYSKGRRDLCGEEPLRLIETYVRPRENEVLKEKDVFVLGDCSSASVDSRVWGNLKEKDIVGRPIVRLWPLERFGPVQSLPVVDADWSD